MREITNWPCAFFTYYRTPKERGVGPFILAFRSLYHGPQRSTRETFVDGSLTRCSSCHITDSVKGMTATWENHPQHLDISRPTPQSNLTQSHTDYIKQEAQ